MFHFLNIQFIAQKTFENQAKRSVFKWLDTILDLLSITKPDIVLYEHFNDPLII